MGDRELSDGAVIALGHLYAKSGHFMEAYRRLYEQVDTSMLSPALRADYLFTLYDFSRDLAGISHRSIAQRPWQEMVCILADE